VDFRRDIESLSLFLIYKRRTPPLPWSTISKFRINSKVTSPAESLLTVCTYKSLVELHMGIFVGL
jgi:hypothetical protein